MEAIDRLLDRARKGESEALSLLYRRFLPGIFGYIATRVAHRSIAEDLTSEVFLAMVENIHRLRARDEAGFIAWLLQIARVTVAGYYRKQEKHPTLVTLESEYWKEERRTALVIPTTNLASDPAHQAEMRDEWRRVVQAINTLTEEQRQVLVGRLILGYDIATVARMMGKKANAIKALQFRALNSLQRLLGKQNNTEYTRQPYEEEIR
jgi:RNA polymerase sigma-70 factor (ECF subfamily)